ncbi:hypothetical protein PG994_000507 [Apiospora phragmitis]|uniref:Uncharacterized protein n=1 Tax=Apiospora phragmitis TaxID=2905665 RepID=A0ABR1X6G7_9PEZI
MTGPHSGGQDVGVVGAGVSGTKRPASDNLGNGHTKRTNTGVITTEGPLITVKNLLNVDFWGLPKLCHRHNRQVGDLGNPFEAVESWARRALPRSDFNTGNPHYPYLTVGSWTMSRFGKPVIVGKGNNFYQSVLDAFRGEKCSQDLR